MIDEDGIFAVKAARRFIESETSGTKASMIFPETFSIDTGVFVTLKKYPNGELRGCIGYPEPVFKLSEALERSVRSACHDPRFMDLAHRELSTITVEVTILTKPVKITNDKRKLLTEIKIGRDGLIIEYKGRRGLLLPQVPEEWKWDVNEYLQNLSAKAGLSKDTWKSEDAVIYSFTGEIFYEMSPNGEVIRA